MTIETGRATANLKNVTKYDRLSNVLLAAVLGCLLGGAIVFVALTCVTGNEARRSNEGNLATQRAEETIQLLDKMATATAGTDLSHEAELLASYENDVWTYLSRDEKPSCETGLYVNLIASYQLAKEARHDDIGTPGYISKLADALSNAGRALARHRLCQMKRQAR